MQQETVNRIATFAQNLELNDETVGILRKEFPDIHFTYCTDDDIVESRPVESHERFNLYLVDGRDHCLRFTTDLEEATGIVLAEIIEEE